MPNQSSARIRKQRACDQCRQRRVRCDGEGIVGLECTTCSEAGRECTYTGFQTRRGGHRRITPEYVEELERTVEKMRALLDDIQSSSSPNGPSDLESSGGSTSEPLIKAEDMIATVLRNIGDGSTIPKDDDNDDDVYIPLKGRGGKGLVLGMSSSARLTQELMKMKITENGGVSETLPTIEPEFWPKSLFGGEGTESFSFPDDTTLRHLVKTYFDCVNIFWPCLHQPTLEQQIAEGLHLTDTALEAKVLMVMAIASQYSPNYNLYWDSQKSLESLACVWFRRADKLYEHRLISLTSVSLEELQFGFLILFFLISYQNGHAGWIFCGLGLRSIEFIGAHKHSRYRHTPPLESELMKRVVWIYTVLDILCSAGLGYNPMHPLCELDSLAECDDEYCFEGDNVEEVFKQPPGKPSRIAYFNRLIPLMRILGLALNTIYSSKHLKAHMSIDISDFDYHLVRELDSAMNEWMEAVPAHLKWDHKQEDIVFFSQSAALYCTFYLVQILIHQPFINPADKSHPNNPLPSMSICLNAARACCRIADAYVKRAGFSTPIFEFPVFTSALILLTSIYRKNKLGGNLNTEQEMIDVKRCVDIIESSGDRWDSSSRMLQILRVLASIYPDSDIPQPHQMPKENPPQESAFYFDTLLSQSWGELAGEWELFAGTSDRGGPDLRRGFNAGPAHNEGTSAAESIPYETLWPNAFMQPSGGIGDASLGTDAMAALLGFGGAHSGWQ